MASAPAYNKDLKRQLINASIDALRDAAKKQLLVEEKDTAQILHEATEYAESRGDLDATNIWYEMAIIIAKMEAWLIDIDAKKNNFENISRRNNSFAIASIREKEKDENYEVSAYRIKGFFQSKNMKETEMAREYSDAQNELLKSYLEGYKLWEAFRSYATGQSLKYSIMYKDKGKLYEAEVSFEEFLKYSDFQLSGNLKREFENDTLKKEKFNYAISIKGFNKREEKYQDIKEVGKFYYQLVDIIKNHLKMEDTNYGQIYETYIEIKNDWKQFPLEEGLTVPYVGYWLTDRRLSVLEQMVKANKTDKSSGRKIGDQGLVQAKNIAQNEAKLGAVRTLISDIQTIVNEYMRVSKQSSSIKGLGNLLIKQLTIGNIKSGNVSLSDATISLNSAAQLSIMQKFLIE